MNYLSDTAARSCSTPSASSRRESKYSDCHSPPFAHSLTNANVEHWHNFTVLDQFTLAGQQVTI
ncbi:hypothetical protein E2C01_043166 [Portunus trituberculatus]|uniref:Uncharacterized protein n=1 Tax=Portunus trituberculatus TaxID=210409 RepID=A0A5B7FVD0_PORTR|nr:hypothetical protein [Portunus trituberculatus]